MNKIIAIIIFPFFWILSYINRIVIYDIIGTIIEIIVNIFHRPFFCFFLLITFPIVLVFEILIGIIVTFFVSIDTSVEIFIGNIDAANSLKKVFSNQIGK